MNHSYYDTVTYENILKSFVGEAKMFEAQRSLGGPKVALVSTLVSGDRIAPFVFRSYRLPYRTQSNYKGWFLPSLGNALVLSFTLRTQSAQV